MADKEHQGVTYKDTLNLPRTDFPIRANCAVEDPKIIERWKTENLYEKAFNCNKGKETFILHDGPPYANANIHLGTAYNKILKDIFSKSQRMFGKHVPVTPGWDCHGLPIEYRVKKEFPDLEKEALRKKCREWATHWMGVQREEFKDLGVVMNWDHPYLTMSPEYEADIIRCFGKFVQKGYIERKNKTVPWCASCQTALATAEIEYQDRKDPSIYVLFSLDKQSTEKAFPGISGSADILVWTTTPWTLPLNRAVTLKPEASYDLLDINGKNIIVGSALSQKICDKLKIEKKVFATCKAEVLVGFKVGHPLIDGFKVPVLSDQFVGLSDGTAAVHTAPGCGAEDYEVGLKNGLEIFSPLTSDGRYAKGIVPSELEGIETAQAHGWVIKTAQERGTLLLKESINHSYPHCWRCRNGLMFRATKQWFCDLSHNSLREKALEQIEKIQFVPARTRNHLKAAVGGRLEWCLSRQRTWGTPIVGFICNDCDHSIVPQDVLENVAKKVEKEGAEYWELVHEKDLLNGLKCPQCGSSALRKETDILDVWFDAGVSHHAVLKKLSGLSFPANLYIEGTDQHRGWFQSSLLTSVVLEGQSCTKAIATHGYTVDEKGHKMSKSLGNVVLPSEMIKKLGTDGLRLWASSIDMESDAIVSETLLSNIQEVFRKIRNTCRFLVSNLYDFDHEKDALVFEKMSAIDQYALQQLAHFSKKVQNAYQQYDLTDVYHLFTDYCATELSSFYLDIIKDRLYTDKASGKERRSAQTACWYILDILTKLMAPILSLTAEQLSDCYQKNKKESIHLQAYTHIPFVWGEGKEASTKEEQWEALRNVRDSVLREIEKLRKEGIVKHSLEAKVKLAMNTSQNQAQKIKSLLDWVEATGQSKEQFLKEYFIVSQCDVEDFEDEEDDFEDDEEGTFEDFFSDCDVSDSGLLVKAGHADGVKCPRCWQWEVTDHEHGLCNRCQKAIVN